MLLDLVEAVTRSRQIELLVTVLVTFLVIFILHVPLIKIVKNVLMLGLPQAIVALVLPLRFVSCTLLLISLLYPFLNHVKSCLVLRVQ